VPVREVADWLIVLAGLEPMPDEPVVDERIGLQGRATTADGWLGFLVRRNAYAQVDPAPDEVQAFASYPVEIDIRYAARTESVQRQEARLICDKLVAARPDLPILMVNDLTILIAAHLPGAGTEYFAPGTSMDATHLDRWQPWVRRPLPH
jgi:hypothetical protein